MLSLAKLAEVLDDDFDPEEGRRIVYRMDEIERRLEVIDKLRDARWQRELERQEKRRAK